MIAIGAYVEVATLVTTEEHRGLEKVIPHAYVTPDALSKRMRFLLLEDVVVLALHLLHFKECLVGCLLLLLNHF